MNEQNPVTEVTLPEQKEEYHINAGPPSKGMIWYLAICSVLWTVLGVISLIQALLSVMIFDAPGSADILSNQLIFLSIFTFPISCTVAPTCAWTCAFNDLRVVARWVILAPLINILTLLGVIYMTGLIG